jgi:EmrB/QacA subfamily drug resistance transporter
MPRPRKATSTGRPVRLAASATAMLAARIAPTSSRAVPMSTAQCSLSGRGGAYFWYPAEVSTAVERQHHNVTFTLLAVAAVAYALLQSLVAPALLTIQHDLHTTTAGAAWILTAYLLSASVVTPVAGRLGDMFGKKRALVAVLVVLAAGTALAAIATSIGLMIAARVVQGAGGAVFPLAFAIIRDEFPRERVPHGIALISAIMGIGGGLGIVLAGPIVQNLSYHWLFWFPLVAVAVATVGIVVFVPESPIRTRGRIDPVGGILLGAWLVALLVPVSEGPTWGWTSARTLGLFTVAAALVPVWVWAESRSRAPLVDMAMMRLRPVWTTNLAALVLGFGMFASFVLVPEFVELPSGGGFGFGASVTQAGLFMVPATLGMLLAGPVSGRLSSTVGSRVPLLLGAFISCLAFVILAAAHGSRWEIYVAMLVMGVGIGFAFASMANLIVESVPVHQTSVATGMNTIVRSIGGAIGSQVSAGIVTATLAANGAPTERGFTIAFAAAAVALAIGFVVALRVPRPAREAADDALAEAA